MSRVCTIGRSLRAIFTVVTLGACGGSDGTCLALPCPMAIALEITITNATTGGTVQGAIVQITGAINAATGCSGTPTRCEVPGYAGTYLLDISAPGFQTAKRTVTVEGKAQPECGGCGSAITSHVDVALVAVP